MQSGVGDLVAAGVRDAGGEAVFAEAAQVVCDFPGGDVLGGLAGEGRDKGAQLAVGEAAGQQPVDEQGLQQRVDAGVAGPQCGDAGAAGHDDRRGQGGERRAPWMGSWLMVWTPGRRRLAVKPICRRSGRLVTAVRGCRSRRARR